MKKRIVAIACAAAMMLALPTLAWAAPSPVGNNTSGDVNGTVVNVTAKSGNVSAPAIAPHAAKTVPAGVTPLVSFEITGDEAASGVTVSFNVGSQYANHAYTIYVEHSDGTAGENITGVVGSDGTITFTVDKLSIFSVVIGDVASSSTTNAGSTSPQTGVDLGTVAGATVVTAIAAGAVFVALRKKVTE